MFRSPYNHQVFNHIYGYKDHLNEVHWLREIPYSLERPHRLAYLKARKELWALSDFDSILEWLRNNGELTVRSPALNDQIQGDIRGQVAWYGDIEFSKAPKWVEGKISVAPVSFQHHGLNQQAEGHGWRMQMRLETPKASSPRFSITNQVRGLITYGFYVTLYDFQRPNEGRPYYLMDVYMLARDFTNLALVEKLAGRISGNALDFQTA